MARGALRVARKLDEVLILRGRHLDEVLEDTWCCFQNTARARIERVAHGRRSGRRSGRSSKNTTKKKKESKKMRGGVTVRAQDLKTRLPEDMFWEIREMHPLLTQKLTNATIKRAVKDYCYNSNPRAKREVIRLFGKIENWDVSNVTNMSSMFASAISFNQPLNNWNVSNVTDMDDMFKAAPIQRRHAPWYF